MAEAVTLAAPTWDEVRGSLLQGADCPVTQRYRALFSVAKVAPSGTEGVALLIEALPLQLDSVLLRHEAAYVLGQCAEEGAAPQARARLLEILRDDAEDCIVRHEAVEALAALADVDALDELEALEARDISEPLRHTCELAVAGLRRKRAAAEGEKVLPICVCQTQYTSRDPAEGKADAGSDDVPAAREALLDVRRPLYERYEALFTLRNVGGLASVAALATALREDASSAVLRHEVAFVLAQMEEDEAASAATAALVASLADLEEHAMVRHEAAIALGTIGTDEAEEALRRFQHDADQLTAESCQVALATSAYWRAWEELEARIAGDK